MKALTEKRTICLKNAGDRMLDADEILHAFDALEATAKAAATGSVPFSRYLRNNTTLKNKEKKRSACGMLRDDA